MKPSKYYKQPTWQIESGAIRGFESGKTVEIAARKLRRVLHATKLDFGEIARFRRVIIGHGFQVFRYRTTEEGK